MFLFIIGLENETLISRGLRNHIFLLGAFQITLCTSALTYIATLFGFDWKVAFVASSGLY